MKDEDPIAQILSGSLLLASPLLVEPSFYKAVVLLSVHTVEDGAMGVIVNRPSGQTLGELDSKYDGGALESVPVYEGGPVYSDQMILSAWKCSPETGIFKLYFGISEEKALEIKQDDPEADIRGFMGYAGWTGGQLEQEIEQDSWIICPVSTQALSDHEGVEMWRYLLGKNNPDSDILPNLPDDPSLN